MATVYSFDVDETLEISNGPIPLQALMDLRIAGHIVGICGNWGLFTARVPGWQHLVSFVNCLPGVWENGAGGPVDVTKAWFLSHLRQYVPADDYVHVGNSYGRTNSLGFVCGSRDDEAAMKAGWRFILEDDFAAGQR